LLRSLRHSSDLDPTKTRQRGRRKPALQGFQRSSSLRRKARVPACLGDLKPGDSMNGLIHPSARHGPLGASARIHSRTCTAAMPRIAAPRQPPIHKRLPKKTNAS